MKRLVVAVLVVGGLAGAVTAAGALGAGAFMADRLSSLLMTRSPFPRCSDDDKRLASALVALSILDARPADAQPYGKRGGGCDDDDRLAYAEQSYRLSVSRADVPSFYREAAIKDGWKPAPMAKRQEWAARVCLAKVIDNRSVYLSVWYSDGPEDEDSTDYFLQVSSSPSGGIPC
ncbi:hypothetical protein [Nonomuraea dietziae]|uniref:hypothetical protein n=1 Tax=Nonomuraea dietziae TaxID=65515 RepID=UPI0033E31312